MFQLIDIFTDALIHPFVYSSVLTDCLQCVIPSWILQNTPQPSLQGLHAPAFLLSTKSLLPT